MNAPVLSLPNDLSYLSVALAFVRENAKRIGFAESEINKIELAVEEAVGNVIKHAFQPEENAEFRIICERVPLGMKTIIKDKGMPFDPATAAQYDPRDVKDEVPESGLGLFLMQQFMDEVSFHNLGREGKELHLIKYLHRDRVEKGDEMVSEAQFRRAKTQAPTPNSIPFTVRRAKPSDAIEIAKCAYDAYQYTYVYEHIYYPDRLGELIESSKIISAIAITKDKKRSVMAHNAVIIDDPEEKIAEMGMTFTKHKYQNQGCGKKLGFLLVKEAIKNGLLGFWGTLITTHVFSQKGNISAGGKECGILLGYYTDAWQWKHFAKQGQRVSAVLAYFDVPITSHLRVGRSKQIFAPTQYREIIERIYANLNRKPKFVESHPNESELPANPPSIKINAKKYDRQAKIEVKSYGRHIIRQIESTVKRLCLDRIEVIYLYLNLADPFTAVLTKDFEALGFFFAGIMPGPVTGDKLILQYLNNVLIDYHKIQLYTNFAKELLAYIKTRDPIRNAVE